MKTRFLIPFAIALSVHAVLFFGFHRGDAPLPGVRERPFGLTPPPVETVKIEFEKSPDDADQVPVKGRLDEALPVLPEPPEPVPTTEIPIPLSPPNLTSTHDISTLPVGPVGLPDGNDHFGPGGPGFVGAGMLDNPPRTRTQLAPVYPYEARKDGRPGAVVVEFIVDEAGHVVDPHVLNSNDPIFDAPTLHAVAKWRFEPGRKHGRIVRFRMAVPVSYAVNP